MERAPSTHEQAPDGKLLDVYRGLPDKLKRGPFLAAALAAALTSADAAQAHEADTTGSDFNIEAVDTTEAYDEKIEAILAQLPELNHVEIQDLREQLRELNIPEHLTDARVVGGLTSESLIYGDQQESIFYTTDEFPTEANGIMVGSFGNLISYQDQGTEEEAVLWTGSFNQTLMAPVEGDINYGEAAEFTTTAATETQAVEYAVLDAIQGQSITVSQDGGAETRTDQNSVSERYQNFVSIGASAVVSYEIVSSEQNDEGEYEVTVRVLIGNIVEEGQE